MSAYKRFLLFGYDQHYAMGGHCDSRGSYSTVDEAKSAIEFMSYDHYDLLDLENRVWVDLDIN